MKHLCAALLALSMLLSLCACSTLPGISIPDPGQNQSDPVPPTTDQDDLSASENPSLNDSSFSIPSDTQQEQDKENDTASDSEKDTEDNTAQDENPPQNDEEGTLPAEDEEYVRTIDPYAPMVALTFDDGPHELYSLQILDILERNHAVATFFEVGYNARLYPDILVRMSELGCEIASHTYAHHDLTTLSKDAMLTDLAKLDKIIFDAVGFAPTLVRPPYGAVNSTVKNESGRAMILWTVDTKDWFYRDTQVLIDYFMNYGDLDGEIVLMHSIHSTTAQAMEVVIPWLIEQGYQLVTVSELMAYYYGELLEANKCYNQTYFARHDRTEFPLELPDEPMQTDIPPYNTVPVVPMPDPDDQPSDDTTVPPSDDTTVPPSDDTTVPPSDDTTVPPSDDTTVPPSDDTTVPPSDDTTVPPSDDTTVPPSDDTTVPPSDDTTVPPSDDTTVPPSDEQPGEGNQGNGSEGEESPSQEPEEPTLPPEEEPTVGDEGENNNQ